MVHHLLPEVVASCVRSIKAQLQWTFRQIVDERPPIATQSCSVSHDAFSIQSYDEFVVHVPVSDVE